MSIQIKLIAASAAAIICMTLSTGVNKAIDKTETEREKVVMPELEIEASGNSAMSEEEIDRWHRFCEVYRAECPLSDDEQLALFYACEEFNVDYFLMLGLINRETHFTNEIGDGGDSKGYCQIQEKWWSGTMAEIGTTDLMQPKDNFRTACAIIVTLLDRYGSGNLEDALTSYNTGHGGDSEYADSVIAYQEYWRDQN